MRSCGAIIRAGWLVAAAAATEFLDHDQLLADVEDAGWFEQYAPFLDSPVSEIQQVYYYRLQSYRQHLLYTGPQYGYLSTEFLGPVGYGGPYGGIVAAAGHHIIEGRWLRDQKPGRDLVNFWLAGPGQWAKEANYGLNPDTFDWAHQFSFWAGSSVWQQYLATGDADFAIGHLENLVTQYRNYDDHFNEDIGLYWQAPVWDASEYTAASHETDPDDPYHGGYGFRPTINSYQYGDAMAIAAIATLKGDSALAGEYTDRASALKQAVLELLWDGEDQFFKHRARDNNPNGDLLADREIMGYLPWMFDLPEGSEYSAAFEQLKDPEGFQSTYGPTTTESRSTWFMFEANDGCCRWNGPSWPFATSQTLTAAENLLNNYPAQDSFSASDYFDLFLGYVSTQFKDGKPYIAEAHQPSEDSWIYDGAGHSEDYNHSTFVDNLVAGLIGLRSQANDSLIVNPLTPSSWEYFGLENVPYHGHLITVIWDRDGSHYNQGQGLRVWVDDELAASREDIGSLTVDVGAASEQIVSDSVNIGGNPFSFEQGTVADASFTSTSGGDDVKNAIDGQVYRIGIPQNSRWTTYQSPNPEDWYSLDLRRSQAVSDVRLWFYSDGGGVKLPTSYDLQYWDGSDWVSVPDQEASGTPVHNARITITFPEINTSQLRVKAPNAGGGTGWGLSEFQVWTSPIFHLQNVNSGKLMGIENESTGDSANVQQYEDNGSPDHRWQFVPSSGGWYKWKNLNSDKVLAVEGASTEESAQLQQFSDTGTDDQLWRVEDKGDGQFIIKNKKSGLVAGVDEESTENSANIVQFEDNGTRDHLWELLPATS